MGSFNQKIWLLSLPTIQLTVFLSVICFNLSPISAQFVYSQPLLPNTRYSPHLPHNSYNLLSPMPKNMQLRRFMWSNNDFYKDITNGANAMRQMVMGSFIKPQIMKFNNFQHAAPSNHIQYIVRKPKKILHIKKVIPKKIIKIVTIPTSQPPLIQPQLPPQPTKPYPTKPSEYKFHPSDNDKYINPEHDHISMTTSKDKLRMIEEEEERRVEATISALFPINNHDENNGNGDYNIVTGKIEEFDDSWKPISMDNRENIEQPKRSHPISSLHINIDDYVHLKNKKKIESHENDYSSIVLENDKRSEEKLNYDQQHKTNENKYKKFTELAEVAAEESVQLPHAFRPKKYNTNRFTKDNVMISGRSSNSDIINTSSASSRIQNTNIITSTSSPIITTTEKPNYPDYYLETFPKDYQIDCATKTPLVWKSTIKKKDTSSTKINKTKEAKNNPNGSNISSSTSAKHKKVRSKNNIKNVTTTTTTEKSVKIKPMRKYSSKVKKFRSTVKPPIIKTDDSIIEYEHDDENHQKHVTLKYDDIQAIPTAFTTRIPFNTRIPFTTRTPVEDDYAKYVTTTTTTTQSPPTTISSIKSKFNNFDKERIKKLRGAKKYHYKE